jgi:hypothetical protein
MHFLGIGTHRNADGRQQRQQRAENREQQTASIRHVADKRQTKTASSRQVAGK